MEKEGPVKTSSGSQIGNNGLGGDASSSNQRRQIVTNLSEIQF